MDLVRIVANVDNLKEGLCYKIGNPSRLNIWEDPWIPTLPKFTPPAEFRRRNGPSLVLELVAPTGNFWDINILNSVFPYHIIREILKIPISNILEQD